MPQLNLSPEQLVASRQAMMGQPAPGQQPAMMGVPPMLAAPPTELTVQQIQQAAQAGVAQPVNAAPSYPPPGPPGGAAMPQMGATLSPITGMAPGAATFNTALGQYTDASVRQNTAMEAYTGAIGDEQAALAAQGSAQQEQARVAADKGAAMQGVDAERETVATTYADKKAQLMAQFDKSNAVQERKMQMAVDAAGEATIHNFWDDKSTGARILGCIAQALSGAANGLAGNPSAPTPLDRIINDDLQRQMANQQNKRQTAQQQQSMYQTMLQATGNRLDAETAFYTAANNRVTAMAQTLADKFATPEAAAAAKALAAGNAQKNAQLQQKRTEMQMRIATQDAQGALNTMGDAERLGAAAGARDADAANKAGGTEDYYSPLPGMLTGVSKQHQTGANYNRVAKEGEAISSYLHLMADARRALETGGFDAYYAYVAEHGVAFNQMRTATGSGARLEGKEETINNSFTPSYLKTYLFGDITRAKQMIEANENAWGGVLLSKYQALNPQGGIDVTTPDIGPVLARVVRSRQPQQPRTGGDNGQVGQR